MDSTTGPDGRTYIIGVGAARPLTFAALVAIAAWPVAAQFLDSTLDDVIDDAIDSQVEEQLELAVEDAVQEQVESGIEEQVETDVADAIGEQIEAGVIDTIEQQIESGVGSTLEQRVESRITAAITQQLESALDSELDDVLDHGADGVVIGVDAILGGAVDAIDGEGAAAGTTQAAAPTDRFAGAVDAGGRAIEREVWVILVPGEHVARIEGWGFTIRERQTLEPLDRVLLRVDAPEERDIAQAALDLALDAPGTLVDFNHVYGVAAEDAPAANTANHVGMPQAAAGVARVRRSLSIGIIDSAVAVEHGAFGAADIVQKDFVPFVDARPLRHGTAVASILVGDRGLLGDRARGARLYAASVFFEDAAGNSAATTASLVEALAWLVGEGVPVVNASLAGPPNRVLEAAIAQVAGRGVLVVAAVGNNGPAGEPLYPAGYESVVAVTAVDSANRIYRYANRGRHVKFAAPGVRVRVADSAGGYAHESGTSMAAPYAAAIIGRSMAAAGTRPIGELLAALRAAAVDLGDKNFDHVYGYGLIAVVE